MLAGSSENNGNWDKKLSEKVSGPNVPMEDWNTPSDQLWDKIESGLPERKKRRGAWIWFFGALSVIALTASIYFLSNNNSGTDRNESVDIIEQSSKIERNENKELNKPKSANDQYSSNEIASKQSKTTAEESFSRQEITKKREQSSNHIMVSDDNSLTKKPQSENIPTITADKSRSVVKESGALNTNKEENLILEEEIKFDQQSSSNLQTSVNRNLTMLNIVPSLMPTLSLNESVNIEQIPLTKEPDVVQKKGSFIIGINFGMFGDFARLNNQYASVVEPFNFRKSSLPGFEGGLSFGYRFNDKWSLLSGLQYRNIRIASGHNATLVYDPNNEVYDGHNYYNTYDMNYATSYGVLPAEMAITRANDDVQEETQVGVEIDMTQSISLLSIPMLVRRSIHTNKSGFWSFGIAAGPSISFPFANSTEIDHTYSTHEDLHVYHADIKDELKDLNPVLLNAEVELMNSFDFGRRGNLIIAPFFRYGFTPLFESDQLSSRSNEFGVRMYYLFEL